MVDIAFHDIFPSNNDEGLCLWGIFRNFANEINSSTLTMKKGLYLAALLLAFTTQAEAKKQ